MIIKTNFICVWFLSSTIWTIGKTDMVDSLETDPQHLIETQRYVIEDMQMKIMDRKKELRFILRELKRYKMEHKTAKTNVIRYLKNKINRFTFIKRMSKDLENIKSVLNIRSGLRRNDSLKCSYEDLQKAVHVILQLQKMYQLNVRQLADGLLSTSYSGNDNIYKEVFLPMTTSDCFEIAKVMYKNKNHKACLPWLHEALRLYENGKPAFGLTKINILQALSRTYDALNNNAEYIKWTTKLLELKPKLSEDEIRDLEVTIDIKQLRHDREYWKKNKIPNREDEWKSCKCKNKNKKCSEEQIKKIQPNKKMSISKTFEKICRGEIKVGHDVSKKLKCWYFSGHHAFTRLARFKAEQVYIQPDIVLIHRALSDTEILTIKRIALPQLEEIPTQRTAFRKTMVYHLETGEFNGQKNNSIRKVMQRIFDLAGLLSSNQSFSITKYEVGGQHVVHKLQNTFIKYKAETYNIGTAMFYLSDVEQGGATVFPLLGLSVYPEKGAALYWTNLLSSGRADQLTAHGDCPVLRGSKWVATKLIDATNQELRRVCQSKRPRRLTAKTYQSLIS